MIRILMLLMSVYSINTFANAFLCVGEAGAGVSEGVENKPFKRMKATVYDAETQKYLLSNDTGSWMVKAITDDGFQLKCESEYACHLPGETVRSFTRSRKTGNFTLIQSVLAPNKTVVTTVVLKGRCTAY